MMGDDQRPTEGDNRLRGTRWYDDGIAYVRSVENLRTGNSADKQAVVSFRSCSECV